MILSESLWPGMTRHGFGYRTCVRVKNGDRESFPVTRLNRWLPLVTVALKEFKIAREEILFIDKRDKEQRRQRTLAGIAFERIVLDDSTGCWLSDNIISDDDVVHTEVLWQIAELDMGGAVLDPPKEKDALRVCDEPDCLNARHYDFTHRKPYRDRLLKPQYDHYETLEDGSVVSKWEAYSGLVMPSVKESIADFRDLQSVCVPYAVDSQKAPLTDNGISKITIDEQTGCWPVRMYYTRPEDFGKGFQYDGYGRLGVGPGLRGDNEPAYQQLAHRVVARAFGMVLEKGKDLNHECGFRPCCYPGHTTQMTRSANVLHGRRMSVVRRQVD